MPEKAETAVSIGKNIHDYLLYIKLFLIKYYKNARRKLERAKHNRVFI